MTLAQAEELFSIMQAQWPEGSIFRYFARRPTDERVHGQAVYTPAELVCVTGWADTHGYNSYVQVNPTMRRDGVRCSGVDITHWSWFLMDIDPIAPISDPMSLLEEVERQMRGHFGLHDLQRIIIDSGRGVQAWYPLDPFPLKGLAVFRTAPIPRQWEDEDLKQNLAMIERREAVPRGMAYWLDFYRHRIAEWAGCVVDTSVSDLPRVMRIPYTINAKTGVVGSLLHRDDGRNEHLASQLLAYAPYHIWKEKDPIVELNGFNDQTPWDKFVKFMSRGGRIFLTEGSMEGGRHRAAASALLSLMELGCGKEQARSALLWGGRLCTPVLSRREIDPMIERKYRRNNGISEAGVRSEQSER